MNNKTKDDYLLILTREQLTQSEKAWLNEAAQQLVSLKDDFESQFDCFIRLSAMARRKSGCQSIKNTTEFCSLRVDEIARLMLLVTLLENSPKEKLTEIVHKAFKYGDELEQITIIKSLDMIDSHGELVELAISNGRTNSLNLFSAIALNNCYPSKHYEKRSFFQIVLKALFMDLNISQIVGLEQRLCPELSQLAMDLVKERVAASRQPPESIACAIDVTHLGADDLAKYDAYVNKAFERKQNLASVS